jgi:cytochrome bd-type quinol oxidase subunit 2
VWLERYRLAWIAAAAQVALILWGWALAQYPYAIRPHLAPAQAAAPNNVLVMMLQVLAVGALIPAAVAVVSVRHLRTARSRGQRTVGYLMPS